MVMLLAYAWQQHQRVAQRREQLNRLIHKVRQERAAKRFSTLEKTSSLEEEALSLSATELAQQIRSNKLNVLDVVTLFAKQCRRHGHQEERSNAITEELYDQAYSQAQELLSNNNNKSLPFYGVPISVKECFAIQGTFSTGGLACRLLRGPSKQDSLIVQIFKKAGALPICCGNTVQTMMLSECVNRIWGRSRNPWDLKRTPGGSSGGDGALVAMRCVP
jgi:Asp-tRNA(Asn)/Glu-tRNA(Gln) amidotransferase A subunit family amidase